MKLSNTEDAIIPQILTPSFNPNFHADKLPKLYKKLFNDKFPDLLTEFGDDFYKHLMNRVINLDDPD